MTDKIDLWDVAHRCRRVGVCEDLKPGLLLTNRDEVVLTIAERDALVAAVRACMPAISDYAGVMIDQWNGSTVVDSQAIKRLDRAYEALNRFTDGGDHVHGP